MPDKHDQSLPFQGLNFFGKITASMSHEINNVLAIVNEYNGLLEDLLYAAEQGRPISNEQLQRISSSISNQMIRGKQITKRMNRFAHSIDKPVRSVDLNSLVDDMVQISERLTSQRSIHLQADLPGSTIIVESNPFFLKYAIFSYLSIIIARAQKGNETFIKLEAHNSGAKLIFTSSPVDNSVDVTDNMALQYNIALFLQARCSEISSQNDHYTVELLIPQNMKSPDKVS
ncbi:hypothetical protein ACFL27_20435 [candidate division CSSED10-310 bacterium]|uniref:Sensor histidine kinase n=1 Tax=candidate division CSSED10-310 bacterium TaxID=2855610 RepID=A0ABV6Z288_UNCC1